MSGGSTVADLRYGESEDVNHKREYRSGYQDTSRANLTRRAKKWRRWAEEMREHGWTVTEPDGLPEPNPKGGPL